MKESFREFSKTDWYSYASASEFDDGSSPLIEEFLDGQVIVIVSGSGMDDGTAEVYLEYYSELDDFYSYHATFKSKKQALAVANSLADELCELDSADEDDIDAITGTYGLNSQ